MIRRAISTTLLQAAKKNPVVVLTGPRQSGKSTLVKAIFPQHRYLNLEDPGLRDYALADPGAFMSAYPPPCVIDEVQYAPQLFSYIQLKVDESRKHGQYILTGSQNFALMENISQSLAGRAGIYTLYPLSVVELAGTGYAQQQFEDYLIKGFYPRIYDRKLDAGEWLADYINTYIERDVRKIVNVGNLRSFRQFLLLCAGRVGQPLNMSEMGTVAGVSYQTIKSWISILEASYIIVLIPPYHTNFNKRIIKAPRLYFTDTGLASALLGVKSAKEYLHHYMRGVLYENLVIMELIKQITNRKLNHALYYWRDNGGHEVDLIVDKGTKKAAVEIKAAKTIAPDFFRGLDYLNNIADQQFEPYLVYNGDIKGKYLHVQTLSWKMLEEIL